MAVAFVLSGAASLGAIQAGMAMALEEHDIVPDLILGTSAGAINGAFLASGGTPEELAEIWRKMDRKAVFPLRPGVGLQAFLGLRKNFVPPSGLRRLLRRHLGSRRIEDLEIPFVAMAADARTGEEVRLERGEAVAAIMASAALPGLYPPVEIESRALIDGGIANNTPIAAAIELGANEVYVLSPGYSCGLAELPPNAFAQAVHAVGLLVQQRLLIETATTDYGVPVHFVPPPCPIQVSPVDFSQADMLIDRALVGTRQWLSNGCPDALPLTIHTH